MNRILFALIASLALAPALPAADEKALPGDNRPPEGFTALFNGTDLTGWQGHITMAERVELGADRLKLVAKTRNEVMAETWTVKDGVINHNPKLTKTGKKEGVSLQTTKDYGDFEMYVDWKIVQAGDSGIYLRGTPQVQIWDSDHLTPNLKDDFHTGSGGLWNNPKDSPGQKPLKKADRPVGEWNTFKIVMKGDKVSVNLNGTDVVKSAPLSPYWDKKKPLPATGPIELQYHGDKLWFKNIYIKELK